MATAKKTAGTKAASKKAASKKTAGKKTPAKRAAKSSSPKQAEKKAKGKKESLIRQKRSTGSGPACWPGFERVPGTKPGAKGSCEPKPHQTAGERKEDARQAAGSKLRKAGGSKAKADRMR